MRNQQWSKVNKKLEGFICDSLKNRVQFTITNYPITIEHFEEFPTPFNMKCPHCRAKLKETKMTPLLVLIAALVVPLLIFLGIQVKSFLSGYFPIVEKVPTVIVFFAFCYPIYALYESFNAIIIFNKGNLQLKKRN